MKTGGHGGKDRFGWKGGHAPASRATMRVRVCFVWPRMEWRWTSAALQPMTACARS